MSTDSRYFPALSMPVGTAGQVLTKNSADPDNGATWADPQAGTGPIGPVGPQGPVGPAGAAGPTGASGASGTNGTKLFHGVGSPASATGSIGDYYIQDDTKDYWIKTGASTWTLTGLFQQHGTEDNYGATPGSGSGKILTASTRVGLTNTQMVSGTMVFSWFKAPIDMTSTQLVLGGETAYSVTPTLVQAGIYSYNVSTGDLTLITSIANDTTIFASANTRYYRSWGSSVPIVRNATYVMGLLIVQASGTLPKVTSESPGNSFLMGTDFTPTLVTQKTGLSSLPSTVVANTMNIPFSNTFGRLAAIVT